MCILTGVAASIISIQGISIIATYACNLTCDHCFFGRDQGQEYLDPDLLAENMACFKNALSWIHFTGGEPLLSPERFFPLLKAVSSSHEGNIGVATNGFWAADPVNASATVARLLDGGVDVFHQTSIPIETIENASRAIANAGIAEHCWIVTSLLPDDVDSAATANDSSLSMANEVSAMSGIPIARAQVRPIGRGSAVGRSDGLDSIPTGLCKDLACCLGAESRHRRRTLS